MINLRRTAIVKMNLVLDIEICSPVTDLSSTFVLCELQDREVIVEMNGNQLLVFVDEFAIRRSSNIVVWPISHSCARLGYWIIHGELLYVLGRGV